MAIGQLLLLLAMQPGAAQPSPPRPIDPGTWVDSGDYPAAAIRVEAQGTVGFRLTIDSSGRVTGCEIVKSAGPALDLATCRLLLQRARFEPARNADGTAEAGTFSSIFNWRLPDDRPTPVPFAPAQWILETQTPDGGPSFCRLIEHGKFPESAAEMTCAATARAGPSGTRSATLRSAATLLPVGQPPAFSLALPGAIIDRRRFSLEVDGKGVVVRCEPDRRARRDARAARNAKDRCSALAAGGNPIFEAAGPEAPTRRALLEYVTAFESP